MVPRVGVEPTTLGLEVLCSIQLSYRGIYAAVRICIDYYTMIIRDLMEVCPHYTRGRS
jgi:hypothetical protein